MIQDTFNQIREIVADLLSADVTTLTPESSPETLDGWDSVQHLNVILAVETRFGLQFDPEEIDQMKNLGTIARVVDGKQDSASA